MASSGWNRPSAANQPRKAPKKPSAMRGIAAGLVVVCALGGLCIWMFSGGDDAPKAKSEKKPSRIAEVSPAPAPKAEVAQTNAAPKKKVVKTKTYFDENGIERYPGGARVPPKHPNIVVMPDRREVKWEFDAEDDICGLVQMEPGDIIVGGDGDVVYGDKFVQSFKESLKKPIVINDSDTPYAKQLKGDVIAVKKDLAEALQRGEDIAKIMTDYRREMKELYNYRDALETEVHTILHDPDKDFTPQECKELVDAANEMLAKKGISPIRVPPRLIARKFGKKQPKKDTKK